MNRTTWLYLLAEFGPIFAFFLAGRLLGFYSAVAVLMITTALACGLSWYLERRLPAIPLVSAIFVFFGGAVTLIFNSPDAIIFTDTLYYVFSAGAIGVALYNGKLLLKSLFETVFAMTETGWRVLTWRWFWFLLIAAILNELVRIFATPEFWVDYRFYKTIGITVFACYQLTLSRRYRLLEQSNKWGIRTQSQLTPPMVTASDIQPVK